MIAVFSQGICDRMHLKKLSFALWPPGSLAVSASLPFQKHDFVTVAGSLFPFSIKEQKEPNSFRKRTRETTLSGFIYMTH
jgi:hypothetical protein